jgi:hypothetical protein
VSPRAEAEIESRKKLTRIAVIALAGFTSAACNSGGKRAA